MFLTTWFVEGGFMVWVVLLVSTMVLPGLLVGTVLAILARAKPALRWPARVFAICLFLFSTLVPCSGVYGWIDGMNMTNEAVEFATSDMQDEMRAVGHRISRYPMYCGSISAMVTTLPAFFLLAVTALPGREADA